MNVYQLVLNQERNVVLTAYLHEKCHEAPIINKRPAVLVLPGGGYQNLTEVEGEPVALYYAQAGYQAFVLQYSVGEYASWPNPLSDYDSAMEMILDKADEWGIYPDKIAITGFSAGGHLAAAAATMARHRPNAAILGYPVIAQETTGQFLPDVPDILAAVDHKTCPCFVFSSRMDNVVPIQNSLSFLQALAQAGIGFESHIYAYGPHGFSISNDSVLKPDTVICQRTFQWTADSVGWLHDMFGDFGDGEMTKPRCPAKTHNNDAAFLSVDCTMEHLMANTQARQLLAPLLQKMEAAMKERYGDVASKLSSGKGPGQGVGGHMTLRAALAYGSVPEEMIRQLDKQLGKIPNK